MDLMFDGGYKEKNVGGGEGRRGRRKFLAQVPHPVVSSVL
jgi:hypothetical protein